MIKVIFASHGHSFLYISLVASHVTIKNHQARLGLVKVNMVMGCTVLRSSRPHLKNIRNWLKMLHVLTPGKKNYRSLIREKLDGYNKIIGLNLNAQKINGIINFL